MNNFQNLKKKKKEKNEKERNEMKKTKEPKKHKWTKNNFANIGTRFFGDKKFPFLFEFIN